MVELFGQRKDFFICHSIRLEKVDNGQNDCSGGLSGKELVNEDVEFVNHHWGTECNDREKLITSFDVLICYLPFCLVCAQNSEHFRKYITSVFGFQLVQCAFSKIFPLGEFSKQL